MSASCSTNKEQGVSDDSCIGLMRCWKKGKKYNVGGREMEAPVGCKGDECCTRMQNFPTGSGCCGFTGGEQVCKAGETCIGCKCNKPPPPPPLPYCSGLFAGRGFIQFGAGDAGTFRLGAYNDGLMILSYNNKGHLLTPQIWRNDGALIPNVNSFDLWRGFSSDAVPGTVQWGDRFLQFGRTWRLGEVNGNHLSMAHIDGKVAQIWRSDGKVCGSVMGYTTWGRPVGPPKGIAFGADFIQIGQFRVGIITTQGQGHFIVSHNSGETVSIYLADKNMANGEIFRGPRRDNNLRFRPLIDCNLRGR